MGNFASGQIAGLGAAGGGIFAADAGYPMASANPWGAIPSILKMDQSLGVFSSIPGANSGGGSCPSKGGFGGNAGFMGIPGMANLVNACMAADAKNLQGMIQLGSMDSQFPGMTSAGATSGGGSSGGGSGGFLGGLGSGVGQAVGGGVMNMLGGLF